MEEEGRKKKVNWLFQFTRNWTTGSGSLWQWRTRVRTAATPRRWRSVECTAGGGAISCRPGGNRPVLGRRNAAGPWWRFRPEKFRPHRRRGRRRPPRAGRRNCRPATDLQSKDRLHIGKMRSVPATERDVFVSEFRNERKIETGSAEELNRIGSSTLQCAKGLRKTCGMQTEWEQSPRQVEKRERLVTRGREKYTTTLREMMIVQSKSQWRIGEELPWMEMEPSSVS